MDGGRVDHERLYKSSAIVTAVFRPLHPDPNCIGQSSSLLLPAIFNPHWFDHLLCTHRPFTITLYGVWRQNKKHPISASRALVHICLLWNLVNVVLDINGDMMILVQYKWPHWPFSLIATLSIKYVFLEAPTRSSIGTENMGCFEFQQGSAKAELFG